jgi:hypothetical protein
MSVVAAAFLAYHWLSMGTADTFRRLLGMIGNVPKHVPAGSEA